MENSVDFFIRLFQRLHIYDTVKTIKEALYRLTPQYHKHQNAMKSFYGQFIHADDLCFDIGANVGNRTKIFLSLRA